MEDRAEAEGTHRGVAQVCAEPLSTPATVDSQECESGCSAEPRATKHSMCIHGTNNTINY